MEVGDMAPALRERLGPEATIGLVQLFDVARQEWTADVTTAAVERFERRLTEETSSVRRDISGLRQEMRDADAGLRLEISGLRQEMRDGNASLRQEMRDGDASVRLEIERFRAELLKWSFAFWFGQVIAVATIVGVMLRMMQS